VKRVLPIKVDEIQPGRLFASQFAGMVSQVDRITADNKVHHTMFYDGQEGGDTFPPSPITVSGPFVGWML